MKTKYTDAEPETIYIRVLVVAFIGVVLLDGRCRKLMISTTATTHTEYEVGLPGKLPR